MGIHKMNINFYFVLKKTLQAFFLNQGKKIMEVNTFNLQCIRHSI